MEFDNYITIIENRLRSNFDLFRNFELGSEVYDLYARYYARTERYILAKKAKIYAIESNEFTLIKHFGQLNENAFEKFKEDLVLAIEHLVNPHKEHMSSIITGVIVIDSALSDLNRDIIELTQNFKYHKGFAFGFKGWVDLRFIIVSLKDNETITNKKGKEVKKHYII